MAKIYFIDVTNRDGVQTARLGLSKLEKTMINMYLNEMGIFSSLNLVSLRPDTSRFTSRRTWSWPRWAS
jgi:hypothetical protein